MSAVKDYTFEVVEGEDAGVMLVSVLLDGEPRGTLELHPRAEGTLYITVRGWIQLHRTEYSSAGANYKPKDRLPWSFGKPYYYGGGRGWRRTEAGESGVREWSRLCRSVLEWSTSQLTVTQLEADLKSANWHAKDAHQDIDILEAKLVDLHEKEQRNIEEALILTECIEQYSTLGTQGRMIAGQFIASGMPRLDAILTAKDTVGGE